jgi:endonuclease G, mitochondrial
MAVKKGAKKKKLTEAELKSLLRKHQNKLLNQPNVNSVGIGFKDNDPKKEMCIQVTVDKKYEVSALENMGIEPLPKTIDGPGGEKVEIHVTERKFDISYKIVSETRAEAAQGTRSNRRSRLDPLIPGASVSHIDGSAGTIGAIVFDRDTGEPYVLSNWHVLHLPTGKIGDKIVQPGPFDDSETDFNYMGWLARSHLGLAGDCAIARIDDRSHIEEILELGVKPKRIAVAELGDGVVKSGRTTGVTYGLVRRTGVVTKLNYGGSKGIQEIGGFEIGLDLDRHGPDDEISKGGDSGSLWMINTKGKDSDVVVGLHFAGEIKTSSDEHAVACNIHSVLEKLKVTLKPPLKKK